MGTLLITVITNVSWVPTLLFLNLQINKTKMSAFKIIIFVQMHIVIY